MNRNIKKILAGTLTLMMIFTALLFLPHRSLASDNINSAYKNAGTLQLKTWSALKQMTSDNKAVGATQTYHVFKLTVPSDGYLKIEQKPKDTPWTTAKIYSNIYVYKKFPKNGSSPIGDQLYDTAFASEESRYVPVLKGTYYISSSDAATIRITHTKAQVRNDNYCRALAKTIKSKQKVTIVDLEGYETDRWYKINLTKDKKITITLKTLGIHQTTQGDNLNRGDFRLYNSGKTIQKITPKGDYKTFTTEKLPKGTYYLRIYFGAGSNNDIQERERIRTLTWK